MFVHVPFQLHGDHSHPATVTVLGSIIYIAITGTYLHLSKMNCLGQVHNIETQAGRKLGIKYYKPSARSFLQ